MTAWQCFPRPVLFSPSEYTEGLYFPQFSSPQLWKGGVGSGTWIVLASRVCSEVTTVTSGWKPRMPVETSPALWGACSVVSVRLFVTPWTAAPQAPLSMGFSRQEYWSGLQFPSPGALPDTGIKPTSRTSPALAGEFFTTSATWEARGVREPGSPPSLCPWGDDWESRWASESPSFSFYKKKTTAHLPL